MTHEAKSEFGIIWTGSCNKDEVHLVKMMKVNSFEDVLTWLTKKYDMNFEVINDSSEANQLRIKLNLPNNAIETRGYIPEKKLPQPYQSKCPCVYKEMMIVFKLPDDSDYSATEVVKFVHMM